MNRSRVALLSLASIAASFLACDDDKSAVLRPDAADISSGPRDAAAPDVAAADTAPAPVTVDAGAADASVDANVDAAPPLAANVLTARHVFAGERSSLAVRPNGEVYAWGQYVDPTNGHYRTGGKIAMRPVKVEGLSNVRVATGYGSAFFALKNDGTVWGWGFLNSYEAFAQGKDGTNGGQVVVNAPVQLLEGAGVPLTGICDIVPTAFGAVMLRSETQGRTCVADEKRSVWYTGSSLTGYESGLPRLLYAKKYNRLTPGDAQGLIGDNWVVALFGNTYYVNSISLYARLNDGRIFAWGNNMAGQLGLNDKSPRDVPTEVAGWSGVRSLAGSSEVTLGLAADGTVLAAGSGSGKTLGLTSVTGFQTIPARIDGLTGVSAISVATSQPAAFAVANGELRYWGSSAWFGAPSSTPRPFPSPANPLVTVSVGTTHALAIDNRGAVYGWGSNEIGGLGCEACDDWKIPTLLTVP